MQVQLSKDKRALYHDRFALVVKTFEPDRTWLVNRRYSEFQSFRHILQYLVSRKKQANGGIISTERIQALNFPSGQQFLFENESCMETRSFKLQVFLQVILEDFVRDHLNLQMLLHKTQKCLVTQLLRDFLGLMCINMLSHEVPSVHIIVAPFPTGQYILLPPNIDEKQDIEKMRKLSFLRSEISNGYLDEVRD